MGLFSSGRILVHTNVRRGGREHRSGSRQYCSTRSTVVGYSYEYESEVSFVSFPAPRMCQETQLIGSKIQLLPTGDKLPRSLASA
jgi:hypothetical protein